MGLLYRRYLASFCFIFLLFSVCSVFVTDTARISLLIVGALAATGAIVLAAFLRRKRFAFAVICVASLCAVLALILSSVFVIAPYNEASEFSGNETVKLSVIKSEDNDSYTVRVQKIGEHDVSIKASLQFKTSAKLSYGDILMGQMDVTPVGERNNVMRARGNLLSLYISEKSPPTLVRGEKHRTPQDLILAVGASLQNAFSDYVDTIYDEDSRGFVKGFLINNTSDIEDSTVVAFRRSGTSHLLAVSGLHIAVLLGSLELLLRRLRLRKGIRCATVSLFGFFFIALTDFAGSAVRSFLMLLCVYLVYMLAEDADTVTALFLSVAIIVLFSPTSVYDVGLWMSFLATLGIITVFPMLSSRLAIRYNSKHKPIAFFIRITNKLIQGILLTIVANMFLLPVFWIFFGSISLAAIPANIILSPLAGIYMPMCALSLMFAYIPLLGKAIIFAVCTMSVLIREIAELFASLPASVLSLRYPFVAVLMPLLILTFVPMLFLRLKRRLIMAIPPIAFVLCFSVCLGVFAMSAQPRLYSHELSEGRYWISEYAGALSVCDRGKASFYTPQILANALPSYSTEIEHYVIVSVHNTHPASLEQISKSYYIRNLYLPRPTNQDDTLTTAKIINKISAYGTNIVLYDSSAEQMFKQVLQ